MTIEELLLETPHTTEMNSLIELHNLEPTITTDLLTSNTDGDLTQAKLTITISIKPAEWATTT